MGETKQSMFSVKEGLDSKLKLAAPNREILEELAVVCANDPSPDNTFQYAFCLSKSTEPTELRYAISILDGLVKEGYEHELDCMYGAATALYLLGDYEAARVSTTSTSRFVALVCFVELVLSVSLVASRQWSGGIRFMAHGQNESRGPS